MVNYDLLMLVKLIWSVYGNIQNNMVKLTKNDTYYFFSLRE